MPVYQLFFYGLLLGIADLVPGFSAGTMAMTLSIYEKLTYTIGYFFKEIKKWKSHLLFIIPIVLGMGISILVFSSVFKYLLEEHRLFIFSFFTGLLLGTTYHIYKSHYYRNHKDLLNKSSFFSMIIGFIIPLCMIIFYYHSPTNTAQMTDYLAWDLKLYSSLFFVGFLASLAMILPGISGSLVLILLGFYDIIIGMIQFKEIFSYIFPIIFFTCGIVSGLILGSLLISKMIKKFGKQTVAFMLAMLVGSFIYILLIEILPNIQMITYSLMISFLLLSFGFSLTYFFGKIDRIY